MLVQLLFKNFLSFKEENILDMTAINAYKEHDYNLISQYPKEKFLKVAAVYGANASGKSNLVLAYDCFQNIVVESFNNVEQEQEKVIAKYYHPFLFDHDNNNTEFEVTMLLGDYEYQYGFEYNDKQIVSEWMYRKSVVTNRRTTIFERNEQGKIEFGGSVRKECEAFSEQILSETLILSFFNRLKLKTNIFNDVYNGIMETIALDTDFNENTDIFKKVLPSIIDENKDALLNFLEAIDTGIKDIYYNKEGKEIAFFTIHKDINGDSYNLPLFSESEGTVKSIVIYIYAETAVNYNKSLIVDELNVKLHPLLLKFIIDLFYEKESKAQLIYTTHDTTLLDKKFFRRDQIWFVQKDNVGHSRLYALSDFKVRYDASFEKDYLGGVYGGIPLLKDFVKTF